MLPIGYAEAPALAGASAGWAHRESNQGRTNLRIMVYLFVVALPNL